MCVCGVYIKVPFESFEAYKEKVQGFTWGLSVDEETGEILHEKIRVGRLRQDKKGRYNSNKITRTTTYKNLQLKFIEVHRHFYNAHKGKDVECFLEIEGSLHKAYYGHNCNCFSFQDLQQQLDDLERTLQVPLHQANIHNIEFGLNLNPAIATNEIVDNIHTYKGKPFYNYKPKEIGGYFSTDRFTIKIYNKGLKHKLSQELLRFEIRYNKMSTVNQYGIKTLADLRNVTKVKSMLTELTKVWSDVIVFDVHSEKNSELPNNERKFLNEVMRRDYWQNIRKTASRKTCLFKKERLRSISAKYGKDIHNSIAKQIEVEWSNLFSRVTFAPGDRLSKINGKGNVCTVKIIGANVTIEKRYCVSCTTI